MDDQDYRKTMGDNHGMGDFPFAAGEVTSRQQAMRDDLAKYKITLAEIVVACGKYAHEGQLAITIMDIIDSHWGNGASDALL